MQLFYAYNRQLANLLADIVCFHPLCFHHLLQKSCTEIRAGGGSESLSYGCDFIEFLQIVVLYCMSTHFHFITMRFFLGTDAYFIMRTNAIPTMPLNKKFCDICLFDITSPPQKFLSYQGFPIYSCTYVHVMFTKKIFKI